MLNNCVPPEVSLGRTWLPGTISDVVETDFVKNVGILIPFRIVNFQIVEK